MQEVHELGTGSNCLQDLNAHGLSVVDWSPGSPCPATKRSAQSSHRRQTPGAPTMCTRLPNSAPHRSHAPGPPWCHRTDNSPTSRRWLPISLIPVSVALLPCIERQRARRIHPHNTSLIPTSSTLRSVPDDSLKARRANPSRRHAARGRRLPSLISRPVSPVAAVHEVQVPGSGVNSVRVVDYPGHHADIHSARR
jgi:hypothetical protein